MAEDEEESMNISAEIIEDDSIMAEDGTDTVLITKQEDIAHTGTTLHIEGGIHESQEPQIIDGDDITSSQIADTSEKAFTNDQAAGDSPQIVMVSGPSHHVAMPTDQLGLMSTQGQHLRLVTASSMTNPAGATVEAEQAQTVNGMDEQAVTLTTDGLAGIPIAQPLLVNMVPETLNPSAGAG